MAMAGRVAAIVCCATSTRGDFYAERGGAVGIAAVQSQQRWSGGCRALLIGGTGRSRRGGPGLMVATARSSSGGRANKQREEKRSRENIIPASPPQPPATSSGVREGDDGVEPKVVSEDLADDCEASAVVGTESGAAELQAAKEDRENSSSSSGSRTEAESADDIGKALTELRKAREALSSQDRATTNDFWKGVAEETRLIEWPVFSKVLGTTGVVVAMIVGSSVVLLTVNAILSASSDYAFNDPTFRDFAKTYLNLAF